MATSLVQVMRLCLVTHSSSHREVFASATQVAWVHFQQIFIPVTTTSNNFRIPLPNVMAILVMVELLVPIFHFTILRLQNELPLDGRNGGTSTSLESIGCSQHQVQAVLHTYSNTISWHTCRIILSESDHSLSPLDHPSSAALLQGRHLRLPTITREPWK